MPRNYLFTSESVTEGHPDKMADQVSDAVLDAVIAQDPRGRVACEALLKTGFVCVAGEITSRAQVDISELVRATVRKIGYTDSEMGFDGGSCAVLVALDKQSPDIARGVDAKSNKEQGAGDQGMMFGFACDETAELMPLPISLAHKITRKLADVRHRGIVDFLRPDGKSQVTVQYENGRPARVDAIVVSTQHSAEASNKAITACVMDEVIKKVVPAKLIDRKTKYFVNPTGRFVTGGPMGDSGLTGRKIIVDTYGGMGRHGGGAFSGKDPSKVDRSAAYMARYIAKNIVAAGLATRCEIQLAYAIGVAEPVSVMVETFGTGTRPEEVLSRAVRATFGLRPAEIIETLDLLRPIYSKTATYGHFGRSEKEFTWERIDRRDALLAAAGGTKQLRVV
jgi:S-adenosylmethionine synthetase